MVINSKRTFNVKKSETLESDYKYKLQNTSLQKYSPPYLFL